MIKVLAFLLIFSFSSSALARPSCKELNASWAKQQQLVEIIGFETQSFPCPSEAANVATAFYYLDQINIINDNGNEIFDYYSYVFEKLEFVFKSQSVSTSAEIGVISIGSGIYATHDSNGNLVAPVGIEGPAALVHERKHMDANNVRHVKCTPSSKSKSCDSQFHDLHSGEASLDDNNVGAYSASIAYTTDALLYGKNNDLSKSGARFLIKYYLSNNFKSSGITNAQYTNVLKRIGAL